MSPDDRPKLPTTAELRRVESVTPGAAKRLMDLYFDEMRGRLAAEQQRQDDRIAATRYGRRHRTASTAAGVALAAAAAGISVVGLQLARDNPGAIAATAGVVVALTGLAGVLVWGPGKSQSPPARR